MAVRRVTEWELREEFNRSGLWERAGRGELLVTVVDEGQPDPAYGQPPGTRSQTLWYSEAGRGGLTKVAVLHQFVLPDGTINNNARRPDPKFLKVGNDIWLLERPSRPLPAPSKPPPRTS
jgi:hypothetical protein